MSPIAKHCQEQLWLLDLTLFVHIMSIYISSSRTDIFSHENLLLFTSFLKRYPPLRISLHDICAFSSYFRLHSFFIRINWIALPFDQQLIRSFFFTWLGSDNDFIVARCALPNKIRGLDEKLVVRVSSENILRLSIDFHGISTIRMLYRIRYLSK